MIDMNGTTILYQKHFSCQAYLGINSLQFEKYSQNIYQKNALVVGMEHSSILILDEDNGNVLTPGVIHFKKPSKALLMHILGSYIVVITLSSIFSSENLNNYLKI